QKMSEDFSRLGGVIVSVVFYLIFLLGTVGNSLVLAVLLRSGQVGDNTTNLFILNLRGADFSFIIFCVPFQATIYSPAGWLLGSFMCNVVHFFINLTMYTSSFTLAAVSVDRCVHSVPLTANVQSHFHPYYYDLFYYANSTVCIRGWEEQNRKLLDTCTFLSGYVAPVLIVTLSYTRPIKYLWTACRSPRGPNTRWGHIQTFCRSYRFQSSFFSTCY
uniref:G-protein coupled receptors family 1 profile domain-containing protein n=1 Tax=Gasterosteus aculeatus aculeatus TaxID=481459 RepID=G3PLS4_GASAC